MDLSIIVVSFNTKELVLECLASINKTIKGVSFEVWLVDNNSTDGTVEAVGKEYPDVTIMFGEPGKWIVSVAVDLEAGKAVYDEGYPFRTGPTPLHRTF